MPQYKTTISPETYRIEMAKAYRALEYARSDVNQMYEIMCGMFAFGGVGACQRLEIKAMKEYGFDRSKVDCIKEYAKLWQRISGKMINDEAEMFDRAM